ncbi:helix-turn-helix domain-containing protein [Actinomyces oricola]
MGAGPMPKLVLAALADQADDDGWCWPSQAAIAERCEMGERTVRRHIATLRSLGLLTPVARSSSWGRRSNGYQLHVGAVVDAGENSLESGQQANLASCDDSSDDESVDNSPGGCVSVEIPATGQSGLLRNRPDWPLAQPATVGRSQPANSGRLLPIKEEPPLEPPDQTELDREESPARGAPLVGSGPAPEDPGHSSQTGGRGPAPAGPGGAVHLLGSCLPERMRVLDPEGARVVAGLLVERLDAGWRPEEIMRVMDQRLPASVGRLSSLVAHRLRVNVAPDLAPMRGSPAVDRLGMSDDERFALARRRSEALAAERPRRGDPAFGRAFEEARLEMPGADHLALARRAADILRVGVCDE